MAADQSESPVTEGIRTLEVRWIFPGELETGVIFFAVGLTLQAAAISAVAQTAPASRKRGQ